VDNEGEQVALSGEGLAKSINVMVMVCWEFAAEKELTEPLGGVGWERRVTEAGGWDKFMGESSAAWLAATERVTDRLEAAGGDVEAAYRKVG